MAPALSTTAVPDVIDVATALGADVIAAASTEEKLEAATALGVKAVGMMTGITDGAVMGKVLLLP